MKRKSVPLHQVHISDEFWNKHIQIVKDVVIPYQQQALNDELPGVEASHAIENFRIAAGESDGDFYGMVFQDSDVAKWLEAVAYVLSTDPSPEMEQAADEVIETIAKAQQPDGYLNTYFTVAKPDKRWTNLTEDHELYCAGHMMEAAVAYYQATGKRKILDVMCRYADYIGSVFGRDPGQKQGYPGHEEIELALVKLYRVTGDDKYLSLAKYFVDERGQEPNYFDREASRGIEHRHPRDWDNSYNQSHVPVRDQTTAEGHSVRAVYLYTGMADVALETNDASLVKACDTLWDNITQKRMYITGGIGSQAYDEGFTTDFDLPNDTAYTETCASIGLVFFAQRMLNIQPDRKYADVMERALYNGILSGMSLDGKSFFYVNPLEVWPEACDERHDMRHVKTSRQGWFKCACCPPNLARMLASLGEYVYSQDDSELYVHLFSSNTAHLDIAGQTVAVEQETNYPWNGDIQLTVSPEQSANFTIALRIPGWCDAPELKVNGEDMNLETVLDKGYAKINRTWSKGDQVELRLPMDIKRMQAHPSVRMNAGKTALVRGPIVYCLEEIDNGPELTDISLPNEAELTASYVQDLLGGITVITGQGFRSEKSNWKDLYREAKDDSRVPVAVKAVPYFAWNNRGAGEMIVWIRES